VPVFRLNEEPWIHPGAAPTDQIAATIESCPSGALSCSVGGVEHRDGSGNAAVGYVPNEPYVVRGGGAVLANAEQGEGASTKRFALCRCGHRTNKPFCSGVHGTTTSMNMPRSETSRRRLTRACG